MKSGRSSIRWRLVLIYFMLVFIAMVIVSVFLLSRIEDYQLNQLKDNITNTINEGNMLQSLSVYDDLAGSEGEIQHLLDTGWSGVFSDEISVVDSDMRICASSNITLRSRNASEVFDTDVIVKSLVGVSSEESESRSGEIAVKNFCFPIESESGQVSGVVYVRSDLTAINSFVAQARMIFVEATLLALAVTIVLGFILARSITVPIENVTETVIKMSQGDFSTAVAVKSDDEIGKLAEMFNMLREKLDLTLSEISNEKNKLGTILENMGDGLIAIDFSGKVIHANPAARAMLGVEKELYADELTYSQLLETHSENLKLEKVKENCKEGGAEDIFETEGTSYAVRYDRFKDEEGNDTGIIFIMQDITERKKLEDMQTDFVANVSHELKTPLTNIKSYTETLIDGAIDDHETAMSFLNIIDSEADRMNRLVKDLLQLSRLDHNQEHLSLKESNIVSIINMAVMKVEKTADQKHHQLNTLYDIDGEIRVMVDRDRFEQVILNILSNSIKYTEDGGRIDVDVFEQSGNARIIVQDNGLGIPAAALPRIFERFYRVDKARSRAMGGTGLGLAITKQIVEEHGGTIEAESQEGHGTKMIITLPLAHRKGIRNIE